MRTLSVPILGLAVALVVLPAPRAHAQEADIVGVIVDTSDAVLPGVTVTAHNLDTGLVRSTTTDAQGRYRVVALPVGRYTLTAELTGFQTVIRSGITLTINARVNERFTLRPAGLEESVTVTGESPIVETSSSEVGVTFVRPLVDAMPLNGRNPTDLLLLAPGVATGRTRGGYSISGSTERNNSYSIDGIDNNDEIVGGRRVDLQQDVVREFHLVTNQFTAEYGRSSGGVINVLTQSGTNNFQGRVNFFVRDDAFDAQPFLSKEAGIEKSPFSRKTYGGFLGGPLVRDRTHFFGSFEDERETENLEWDLPTIDYPSVGPYPSITGGFRVASRTTKNPKVFGKFSHQLSPAQSLAITGNYDRSTNPMGGCSGTDLTCFQFEGWDFLFIATHTWVVSDRMVNELRVARPKYDYRWSVPGELQFPLHNRPGISYGQQSNMPQGRDERHWVVSDTLSRVFNWAGDHDLRIGGEVNIERSASFFDSNFGGTFAFDTDVPFDPADVSTYPFRYTVRSGDSTVDRDQNIYAAFVQDNWRIKPSFTLNLGVRYDVEVLAPHLRHTGQAGLFNLPALSGNTDYRTDWNNVAPRLGFAWDPWNTGRTVIRGGTGLYYDQVFLNIQGNVYRFGVVPRTVDLRVDNPCYPDPNITIAGVCGQSIVPGAPTRSPTVSTGRERSPYAFNTSIGVAQQLFRDLALTVDFVRLRTYDWPLALDLNPRCTLTASREGDCTGPIGSNASRPDPNWVNVQNYATEGDKWHRGLQIGLNKRLSHNYQFRLSYTLAKTEDNADDFVSDPQSYFRPERERALSNEDQRHRVALSGSWRLPWGLQVAGILTYASGRPFDIRMGTDWNGNGNSESDRPDSIPTRGNIDEGSLNDRPYYPEGPRLRGADGIIPRNAGDGPDFFTVDMRVSKFIRLGGERSLELLAEFFNLTNRVNVGQPSGDVRSSQYYLRRLMRGEIADTSTFDPFQGQIGFRLNF